MLALAFSPDGGTLASGSGRPSRSGEIKLWKVADGSLVRALAAPHSDTVMTLEFSRGGDRLASWATDRLAKVHAVADGRLERTFEGHTGHVLGVAWQAHGRRLATAGADGAIKVWDVLSGEQQRSIAVGRKEVTAIEFLAPGEEFAAASGEPAVRLYNAGNGSSVRQYETAGDFVQSLALAGTSLAAGTQDGKLRTWNVATGGVLHTVEPSPAPAK
ncbi:MAG: WD40 repeat domain-containing protein [Planctomycetia bacterium]